MLNGETGNDNVGVTVSSCRLFVVSTVRLVRSEGWSRCRWSGRQATTISDSVDSSLVGERVYCLVEAVGCCWSVGTGNNNISYNS